MLKLSKPLIKQFHGIVDMLLQGGQPSTREAKLAHAASKPANRAMPTRFSTNMLMLNYWQAKLLTALVDVE